MAWPSLSHAPVEGIPVFVVHKPLHQVGRIIKLPPLCSK
jgi:hypothetical protein